MSQDEMERASPGAANGSGSSSSDAEPAMVVTRSRRSNAGNWMRKLLDQEERPDEHQDAQDFYNNEHWAEDADDDEFGGADAVAPEDVALESSGDEDEDEGEQDDDDAGEKVLRKEERQQKLLQKRKRKDPFAQAALRQKKAKTTTPTESMPPPPRPKKKSERVSWLPEATEGPVRSSSRRLTVQNKQVLTQGLEEKERHRLHVLEVMKRAERRKEKDQPKPMTQQERLVEAARVEKRNSKTLSRWEESERLKAEENKARLEALKNRKLDGPFVRYYSGPSLWVNDKLKHVGKDSCKIEELDDEPPLANDTETSIVDAQPSASAEQGGQQASGASQMQSAVDVKPEVSATNAEQVERAEKPAGSLEQTQSLPSESAGGFLDGIFDWASMDAHQTNGAPAQRPPSAQSQLPLAATGPVSAQESSKPINADGHAETSQQVQSAVPVPPPPPRVVLRAVRNLITLQNFDSLRPRDKDALSRALFKWPAGMPIALPTRPPPGRGARNAHLPHRELCCITAQPARYRDPLTGLPYADAFAFRSIRRFVSGLGGGMGTARWSNLLGCFVGPRSEGRFAVAKGVPERFTGKKKEVEPEKTAEAVQEEQPNGQDVKMEGT
ncbi:Signal transducer [Lasiodiplodia theobromae]|uniref:Signal transducer n=1 Tax=Lasiodiplodia theobromae TaxID=45133 RepID=UPI0015C3C47F|nr:Signal transducer [Lasiodiplodia theobromae]KAF4535468.1 Signal transducer [Lasiodiplodia theobromae]